MLFTSSLNSGGAERVAVTLANAWTARGDQMTLMPTFSGGGECFYELSSKVNLVYLADLLTNKTKTLRNQINRLLVLRKFIKDEKPDVLVSFLPNVNVATVVASLGLGIPLIVCEHNEPFVFPISSALRLATKVAYPLADGLMVLTDGIAAKYAQYGWFLPKIHVVPNPFFGQLMDIVHDYNRDTETKWLIGAGTLNDRKQFGTYIRVFAKLAARYPQWNLRIVGDGPLRNELQQKIEEYGLQSRIDLPGITPSIQDELNAADIFALTSKNEGFPMVLLEAMAVGLPCVSFDCPSGPREMSMDGKVALLVPLNDEQELELALEKLMVDTNLRQSLGSQARVSVIERYSLPTILKKWDAIFDEIRVER